jgi:hypothetical protein
MHLLVPVLVLSTYTMAMAGGFALSRTYGNAGRQVMSLEAFEARCIGLTLELKLFYLV